MRLPHPHRGPASVPWADARTRPPWLPPSCSHSRLQMSGPFSAPTVLCLPGPRHLVLDFLSTPPAVSALLISSQGLGETDGKCLQIPVLSVLQLWPVPSGPRGPAGHGTGKK